MASAHVNLASQEISVTNAKPTIGISMNMDVRPVTVCQKAVLITLQIATKILANVVANRMWKERNVIDQKLAISSLTKKTSLEPHPVSVTLILPSVKNLMAT